MLLGVAIVIIAAFSYHKRSSIRMQAAHQKIDELSQRMAEQEKALLKQQQLADKAGVKIRMIKAYEQNYQDISKAEVWSVIKLARALNCSPEDILS